MQMDYEEKFLTTRQERIKLNIALTRFFEVASDEWKERYGAYLKKRFRAAMNVLIEEGNLFKIEQLCDNDWYTERMLQEFMEYARQKDQLEIFVYLLRLKREKFGFLNHNLNNAQNSRKNQNPDTAKSSSSKQELDNTLNPSTFLNINNDSTQVVSMYHNKTNCSPIDEIVTIQKPQVIHKKKMISDKSYIQADDMATVEYLTKEQEINKSFHLSNQETLCEEILNQIRTALCLKYPFFAQALYSFSFQQANQPYPLMGTDGKLIYYRPELVLSYYQKNPEMLSHIFMHMFYHRLFSHLLLPEKENVRLWHLACDIAAEELVNDKGSDIRTPEQIYTDLTEKMLSEEELKQLEASYQKDEHAYWKNASQKALSEKLLQEWNHILKGTGFGSGGQSGGIGSVPGTQIEEMLLREKHKYDFCRYLKRFAISHEEMQTDMDSLDYIPYLYGLQHYGNIPLVEHPEQKEVHKLEELVIAIDTSGSCSLDTVRRFMEETYGILSNHENFFKKMNVYILQCDCYIQHEAHISCEEDWKQYMEKLQIHGRSGTDFRPVFKRIEQLRQEKKLRNLKALLYFTDGDGIYPQTPVNYETAFVFYQEKERHQKVPSWAVTLTLE